jgi:hypothetical protein
MAHITSANVTNQDSPSHAEAAAKLVAEASQVEAATAPTGDNARTARRHRYVDRSERILTCEVACEDSS